MDILGADIYSLPELCTVVLLACLVDGAAMRFDIDYEHLAPRGLADDIDIPSLGQHLAVFNLPSPLTEGSKVTTNVFLSLSPLVGSVCPLPITLAHLDEHPDRESA